MRKLSLELLEGRTCPAGITLLPSGDVQVEGTAAADLITFSATNDPNTIRVRLNGTIQNVTIAPAGKLIAFGFGGNDRIDAANVHNHSAVFDGGDGADYIAGAGANDVIFGGAGLDRINAAGGDDRVYGGADRDIISGGAGNDFIAGNDGNDDLYGDGGNDVLVGGDGADVINGGDGNDLAFQAYAGITAPTAGDDGAVAEGDADDVAMASLAADWASDGMLNLVTLDLALIGVDDGDADGIFTSELTY